MMRSILNKIKNDKLLSIIAIFVVIFIGTLLYYNINVKLIQEHFTTISDAENCDVYNKNINDDAYEKMMIDDNWITFSKFERNKYLSAPVIDFYNKIVNHVNLLSNNLLINEIENPNPGEEDDVSKWISRIRNFIIGTYKEIPGGNNMTLFDSLFSSHVDEHSLLSQDALGSYYLEIKNFVCLEEERYDIEDDPLCGVNGGTTAQARLEMSYSEITLFYRIIYQAVFEVLLDTYVDLVEESRKYSDGDDYSLTDDDKITLFTRKMARKIYNNAIAKQIQNEDANIIDINNMTVFGNKQIIPKILKTNILEANNITNNVNEYKFPTDKDPREDAYEMETTAEDELIGDDNNTGHIENLLDIVNNEVFGNGTDVFVKGTGIHKLIYTHIPGAVKYTSDQLEYCEESAQSGYAETPNESSLYNIVLNGRYLYYDTSLPDDLKIRSSAVLQNYDTYRFRFSKDSSGAYKIMSNASDSSNNLCIVDSSSGYLSCNASSSDTTQYTEYELYKLINADGTEVFIIKNVGSGKYMSISGDNEIKCDAISSDDASRFSLEATTTPLDEPIVINEYHCPGEPGEMRPLPTFDYKNVCQWKIGNYKYTKNIKNSQTSTLRKKMENGTGLFCRGNYGKRSRFKNEVCIGEAEFVNNPGNCSPWLCEVSDMPENATYNSLHNPNHPNQPM